MLIEGLETDQLVALSLDEFPRARPDGGRRPEGLVTHASTCFLGTMQKKTSRSRRRVRGETAMPAAATLIGMRLESFAAGEALVTLDATAAHANPMGTVQGGILAADQHQNRARIR